MQEQSNNMEEPSTGSRPMTPQEVCDRFNQLKAQRDHVIESMNNLMEFFATEYQCDLEYPVTTPEGKQTHIRLTQPDGRYVYNTKYEFGFRQVAKNLAPNQ